MLEHGTLLVYASEDDWAEHQEPLDDVALSAGSTVETAQEGGEVSRFLPCGAAFLCTGAVTGTYIAPHDRAHRGFARWAADYAACALP